MAKQLNIHVMGLGVRQQLTLADYGTNVLLQSDIIIGSQRQLDVIGPLLQGEQHSPDLTVLPKLTVLKALMETHSDKTITVLASGDPLFYGIGRWLSKNYPLENLTFYPNVSSVQVACHKQGLSLQDVTVLSLHGRPLEKIRTQLKANRTLVILTDKNSQPQSLAQECVAAGFSQSILTVYENLGHEKETVRQFNASNLMGLVKKEFDPLHVTIINVKGKGGVLPEFPGIPDADYVTGAEPGKGMISKREVRLSILSYLQVSRDDIIWDIGAGCGGVAVELAYWNECATIYAIEYHAQRLEYLRANQLRFGVVSNLKIVEGRAPTVLADIPLPNKVFIGGSDGELSELLKHVWERLPEGGLLVASAVMEKTKQQLRAFSETMMNEISVDIASAAVLVESVEIGVKRSCIKAGKLGYVTKLPVEIFKMEKRGTQ